jgi:hypothetical protein
MSVTELKQVLHSKIEEIDDENRLEEILSLVDAHSSANSLSTHEIAILEERHEQYLKGEEKEMPIEEFNAQLRKKYGF